MQIWVIYNNDYPHSCYTSKADAEDALKLYRAFEKKLRDEARDNPNHDFRTWINYGLHGPFETSITQAPRYLDAREKILWNKVLDETPLPERVIKIEDD